MTPKEQAMNLLGLAQRAGRLTTGEGFVLGAIQKQTAKFVLIAADASQGTRKKFTDKCSYYAVPNSTTATKAEISEAIGQDRSLVAVLDSGFAKKLQQLLT